MPGHGPVPIKVIVHGVDGIYHRGKEGSARRYGREFPHIWDPMTGR